MSKTVVKDYGWTDAEPTPSHSYLEPLILRICERYGFKNILDLGCGNGALCRTLRDAGYELTGCDVDAAGIELARHAVEGVRFERVGMDDDPALLGQVTFDAVISTEVVEHLYAPRMLPRFAAKVVKPGGYLVVTTPYHGYLKNLVLSLLNKWDTHLNPMWDGGHIKLWSCKTLTKLLNENGFEVLEFGGVGRVPYMWKSMAVVARLRQ